MNSLEPDDRASQTPWFAWRCNLSLGFMEMTNFPNTKSKLILLMALTICLAGCLPLAMVQRIPPYAIEASALMDLLTERVPELRSPTFDQRYEPIGERNTRPDAIPFSAGGMLCRLESKEEYCIAFEIGSEVMNRPAILEHIKAILSDPCAEVRDPVKNFSDSDKGKPDYWDHRLDYAFKVDKVERIRSFFHCAEASKRHYDIVINVVRNLDDWMNPFIARGEERKKKLRENLVEQIVVPVY